MKTKLILLALMLFLPLALTSHQGLAQQKLRFGTSLKTSPHQVLPPLAAEEKGLWKPNGLDAQWISFEGGAAMYQAVVAGAIDMGLSGSLSQVQFSARGVPVVIVADTGHHENYYLWVRADSPIKEPKDLKGARVDVARFGGVSHAYGQFLVRTLSLEKEVKLVAVGGITQGIAALRSGAVDGRMSELFTMGGLKHKGEVREVVALRNYLPKEWLDLVVFAKKDFILKNPEPVKRAVKAVLQAAEFVTKNPRWATAKMVSVSGYTPEGAQALFPFLGYRTDGRVDRKAVANVRDFLIEYGLIAKEKAPGVEELFTNDFTS